MRSGTGDTGCWDDNERVELTSVHNYERLSSGARTYYSSVA